MYSPITSTLAYKNSDFTKPGTIKHGLRAFPGVQRYFKRDAQKLVTLAVLDWLEWKEDFYQLRFWCLLSFEP